MTATAEEPYVGLRPFAAADRRRFFGRTAESRAVFERWSTSRAVVLHGPPGVGKTSLIQAGVIPLVDTSNVILPVGSVTSPWAATPSAVAGNPPSQALISSWSRSSTAESGHSIVNFLQQLRPPGKSSPVLAAIDHFEWLFQGEHHRQYQQDFLDQLIEAVRQVPHLHLLISIREDFLGELDRLTDATRYQLGPLLPNAALDAVVEPLRGTGQSFAPGAAEEIVHNLRTGRAPADGAEITAGTVEPAQLQVTCSALWRAMPESVIVTTEHLYGAANLDSSLALFCEQVIRDVALAHHVPEPELLTWLARTFITDRGTRGTTYEGVTGVDGMPTLVAEQLVDQYILVAEHRLGARWYRFPNDRLVTPVRECLSRWTGESAGPAASLAAAEGALAAGDLTLAARRASEAVRTSGSHDTHTKATALFCLGQVAVQAGHDVEAVPHFRAAAELFEVIQDQAGSGRLLGEIGRILLRSGRYADAVAELQSAEVRRPSDLSIQLDLARALRDCGQLWAATAVLNTTLTIAPGTVEALVERGLIRVETGDPSYALDDLNNAIRLSPAIGQQAEIRSAQARAQAQLNQTA